ncbi:MAG: ABC transporter ATP-binding protein [Clostridiaceae bacterium]
MINIDKVTKSFGNFTAVNKISLKINEGEIYGLLGPNGAGKSTTINMICGLLKPTEGSIDVFGKDVKKQSNQAKMNIGVVPQDIAIYSDLTCLENVKFFASLYGFRGKELKERSERALDFVGLLDRKNDYPGDFSGGMKRRLNIACAIAHTPKVIIMDEPTVGIDPQSRNHILNSVKTLNKEGCTIIYTSHYMEEIETVCSKIGIIDHGKLIAEGTKEELKTLVTDKKVINLTIESLEEINEKEIKAIEGIIDVEKTEKGIKLECYKEVNNLDKIILYFTSKKIGIKEVISEVPDLETVFLALTGRKLRD